MREKIASHFTCDKQIGRHAMINGSTFSRLLHVGFFALAMSQAALAQEAETESEAPASITLTLPDGSKTTLLVDTIRRIRKAVSPETQSGAKTRIDWLQLLLVRESPEDVAALVEQSVPSLAKLRMPEGSPIWFRGGIAQGPMPLTRDQLKNGVRSAIVLGDSMQFLSSTPEEVRQELSDKGGNALPEPQAVASLSPQGQKGPKPTQKSQEQVQVAAQTVQPSQEQALPVGEIIRLQQAQAEPAEQVIPLQQAQAEAAPQLVEFQQEQVQQVGEIIRLQRAYVDPVGQIIRLQQAQAEPAPQLVQAQQEQVQQQVGEIIPLQQAQAEPVGQIIRLQQAQAEPVGQIIRLQQAQAEPVQQFSPPIEEPLEWLDGFSERTAQGRQAAKRDQRTAEDQRVKQAQRISRGL